MQKRIDIQYKLLDELIPDAKNPRRNDMAVAPVMESIREFGFRVPLVIDKDGVIRAGHTRFKAAKALGMAKVPCVTATDLTAKQLKAFQLADNKTSELATWDEALLTMEMSDLRDLFDMTRFGFEGVKDTLPKPEHVDSIGIEDDYVTCPRCGKRFLKAEGHPASGDLEEGDADE